MFDVKCQAEIRHLNYRKEIHGDEFVAATDVKVMLIGVPVDRITSACPDISKRFYEGEIVAVGEVSPLIVGHKLENLAVTLGQIEIKGVDIKKGMKVHLLPQKIANVECSLQFSGLNDRDDAILKRQYVEGGEYICEVNERQLKVAGMDQ